MTTMGSIQDQLRPLSAFRARRGVVVSLSFGLDADSASRRDATSRLSSLLAHANRESGAATAHLGHAERVAFRLDLDRAAKAARDARGSVACFADDPDGLWQCVHVDGHLADAARVGSTPYLAAIAAVRFDRQGLVANVGRELGEIYTVYAGRLEKILDLSEQQPARHRDAEAWQQRKLERRTDQLAHEHLRRIATELDRLAREGRAGRLVLSGEQEHTSAVATMLSHEARLAFAGTIRPEAHAGAIELTRLVMPVFEQKARDDDRIAIDRWRSATGSDGHTVTGWPDTLAAASDGRVALLLFRDDATGSAFECSACGRGSGTGGSCPVDGSTLETQPDALDLVVRLALAHGGSVRAVRRDETVLGSGEGVGALVRY